MEPKTRIRAIGRSLWIVLLVLLLLSIPLFFREGGGSDLADKILLVFCILTFCPYCVYRLCHDVYITNEGIECCRFGSVIRVLPWSQVSQVCIARDYRFSTWISGSTRIIITPRGCPAFRAKEWTGIRYLFAFRGQAVWIDHSRKNCELIEKYWGKVTPLQYK